MLSTIKEYPWQKVPLIRALLPFVAGITIYFQFPDIPVIWQVSTVLVGFISYSFLVIFHRKTSYSHRYVHGVVFSLAFLCAGYLYCFARQDINQKTHFTKHERKNTMWVVKVSEIPVEKAKTIKVNVRVTLAIKGNKVVPVNGKSIFYFSKDSLAKILTYGDRILVRTHLSRIEGAKNPGQFNYRKFLIAKRIHRQAFVKSGNWQIIDHVQGGITGDLIALRKKILDKIDMLITDKDESAIASALLVGYKEEMSNAVRDSFSSTGAMHVLAVSGLHVGIIFLIFSWLFKPFRRGQYGKFLVMIGLILILWAYAFLTGMSPSVFRACTMFSFVVIGQNLNRVTNIYSSILASLIVLLIIDPFMISQVGFQLSYVAVTGIVAIQPFIYSLWKPRFWLIEKIWAITAVSLAAQISTFPLAIFYFNQFPVYFFISNLVVIPAAMLIIIIGLLWSVPALLFPGVVSELFGFLLKNIIHFLNYSILQIQHFPGGLIREIYLTRAGLFCIYIMILFLVLFILKRQFRFLLLSLLFAVFFLTGHIIWDFQNQKSVRWVSYSIPGHSLTGFYAGKQSVFWGDSSILNDSTTIKYNTWRDLWHHGIKAGSITKVPLDSNFENNFVKIQHNLAQFNNVLIYTPDSKVILDKLPEELQPDFLVLNQRVYIEFDTLDNDWDNRLILDASFPWRRLNFLRKKLDKAGVQYFDLDKNGAVILKRNLSGWVASY